MKVTGKDFDAYLRLRKGTEAYHDDKVKSGRIGGTVSRNTPDHYRATGQALGLANLKRDKQMTVLCMKAVSVFRPGKKYRVTVGPGAKMKAPVEYQFTNWVEFSKHFRHFKELKETN